MEEDQLTLEEDETDLPAGDLPGVDLPSRGRVNYRKAPLPYFGGKSQAAPLIWSLLGDVVHFVEPFCGSLAVLLNRPHPCNRTYYSETVGDTDALLCNVWRSITWYPDETAAAASWPVSELDKQARQIACLRWVHEERNAERLAGDARWCDPEMAGWWLYGVCCQIGAVKGPWTADPVTGRIVKIAGEAGVSRVLPHLGNNGRGVNRPQLREAGVSRKRPHLGNNGQGVNRPQLREAGVSRDLPHLGDDGQGVNRPQLREAGVSRDLPHLGDNGQGVNHAGLREAGVRATLPHLGNNGRGVNRPQLREAGVGEDPEFHAMTMPELRRWFRWLAARLRHVRIVNGDWTRLCTTGAMFTLPVRQGAGPCGVFLDPPYANEIRADDCYRHDDGDVTHAVREWCKTWGPDPRLRIVLAGYDTEHTELEAHGWRVHEWFRRGYLRGGMGNIDGTSQQGRERLWSSPHCLTTSPNGMGDLFAGLDEEG